jgi:hypothetical protein
LHSPIADLEHPFALIVSNNCDALGGLEKWRADWGAIADA